MDAGVGSTEVNQLQSGGNYGWNIKDGTSCIRQSECGNIRKYNSNLLVHASHGIRMKYERSLQKPSFNSGT